MSFIEAFARVKICLIRSWLPLCWNLANLITLVHFQYFCCTFSSQWLQCSYVYNISMQLCLQCVCLIHGKVSFESSLSTPRNRNLKFSLACISILIKDSVSANQSARYMLTRFKKTFKSFKTSKQYQSLVKRLLKQRMVPLQVSGVLCLTEWIPCLTLKVEPTYIWLTLKKFS